MEINLKKKIMLAVLAGNMLCMGQGLAAVSPFYGNVWYGDASNPSLWKGAGGSPATIDNPCASGANLVLDGTSALTPAFSSVNYFVAGFGESGEIKNNYLTIKNGCDLSSNSSPVIYVGRGDAGASEVSGNHLIIEGGTFAASSQLLAGRGAQNVPVSFNKVEVANGNFSANSIKIYGGEGVGGGTADATHNQVTITNGTFGSVTIYGAKADSSGTRNATDNTVDILGGTFDNDNFNLYGGYTTTGTSERNELNLKIKMGGRANEVKYFQIMNFTLPSDIADGDTMLKTTNMKFDTTNTTINVDASAATLNGGDIITLIDSTNPPEGFWTAGTVTGAEGTITLQDKKIIFTVTGGGGGSEDQQKAPVEGVAAAAAIVNASADLASGEGMSSLVANTAGGTDTFGAMSAGSSKYKTGSHVDVDGWGVVVGAGRTKEWKDGSATTYGLFFEYGKGDFDTYNGNVHGDGNSENKGVGIMARHKLSNNTYYEGNIRYGKQETEWSESELGSYDTDSRYYGISVGMGHIFPAGKNEIDVYGRYTYGHVGACDATVGTSEYHFDSVKSHRVRVGGKYNFKQKNSNAKPYVGLAWEREFKGESKASIAGVGEAPAPSMKGNTGILEVGCDWNVSKKWTVGLGANAYMGKRKGWDGMARVFYNF